MIDLTALNVEVRTIEGKLCLVGPGVERLTPEQVQTIRAQVHQRALFVADTLESVTLNPSRWGNPFTLMGVTFWLMTEPIYQRCADLFRQRCAEADAGLMTAAQFERWYQRHAVIWEHAAERGWIAGTGAQGDTDA